MYAVYYDIDSTLEFVYPDFNSTFVAALQAQFAVTSLAGVQLSVISVEAIEVASRDAYFTITANVYAKYEDLGYITASLEASWFTEFAGNTTFDTSTLVTWPRWS